MLLAKTLRSTTFRLALASIAVFGAVVIALFAYVYWSTASFILSRTDRDIETERAGLHRAYDRAGRDGLIGAVARRIADEKPGDARYLFASPSYDPVAGNLKSWPSALIGAEGRSEFRADAPHSGAAAGQALWRGRFETLPDGFHLLVAKNIDELVEFTNSIRAVLAATVLFIFALAVGASIGVTRRTVGRIESVNATSRAIVESGLGRRIPLRGTQDEWDQLALNLNSMLDRIEVLMGEVKQVTDNVAHDLRTPLTRMRGRLETASVGRRDPDRDQSLINATLADLDEVLRMFSALTRISQIEAARRTAAFRRVNLVEIATQVAELFDAAAEVRGGRLEVRGDEPVHIVADRDLLFDAMANLVDNAIKHGREAGYVVVALRQCDSGAIVSVADDGPGIPADELQYVFRRFYRLERSRCTPGYGLGLSLVAAVVRLHGARIDMLDNAPGLKIELHFPPTSAAVAQAQNCEMVGQ